MNWDFFWHINLVVATIVFWIGIIVVMFAKLEKWYEAHHD